MIGAAFFGLITAGLTFILYSRVNRPRRKVMERHDEAQKADQRLARLKSFWVLLGHNRIGTAMDQLLSGFSGKDLKALIARAGHEGRLSEGDVRAMSYIGAILLATLSIFFLQWAVILAFLLGYMAPFLWLRQEAKTRLTMAVEEMGLFLEVFGVYAEGGYNLLHAVEASLPTLNVMRPHFEKALSLWGDGPEKALDTITAAFPAEEIAFAVSILKQGVGLSPAGLLEHINREAIYLAKIREAGVTRKIKLMPMLMTVYLGIPFALLGFLLMYPLLLEVWKGFGGL